MFRLSLCLLTVLLMFSNFCITWAQDASSKDVAIRNAGLFFFSDQLTFNQSCNDLAIEEFEDTNVDPDSDLACAGPFSSITNNNCYSEGALVPGFSLAALGNESSDLIVITPPLFSVNNVAVGPDDLTDDTQITFDPPESGVGLLIVTPLSSGILTVEVYGPGDAFLGTADLNMETNNIGTFLGVTSEEQISRIVLNNNGQNIGELLYELLYGDCGLTAVSPAAVPTLSAWGLIATAGVLALIGLIAIRRMRAVAETK